MKNYFAVIVLSISTALTGCTYIQGLFPDKERDYQYTTEIPLLNWPAGLRGSQSVDSPSIGNASEVSPQTASDQADETGIKADDVAASPTNKSPAESVPEAETTSTSTPETANTSVTPTDASDEKDVVSSVNIVKYDDGESRLRIGAGFAKAWRVVSKALSHNSIEVTERNHDQGQITVQYDPDEKKAKDGSYMDELSFLFHGINAHEREYFLKLEEHDQQTDVIVMNEEYLPLVNDDAVVRLLKVVADTIKTDLADKK